MPRHPEPDFIKQYNEWVKAGPPKCCHTCDKYGRDGKYKGLPDGHCAEFDMEPPEDFAATPGACKQWEMEIPF